MVTTRAVEVSSALLQTARKPVTGTAAESLGMKYKRNTISGKLVCDMRKVLLLALVGAVAFVASSQALTCSVEAHKEECFYEEVPKEIKVSGSFQVTAGGSLDIDVKITGPNEEGPALYEVSKQTEGAFAFTALESGVHKICFNNKMSTLTTKIVSFAFNVGDALTHSDVAKKEHLTPLETSVVELATVLTKVQEQQKHMRMRERVHRNTTESTNARVLWWSFIEAIALVFMSLWQIYYLRRFFEVKRVV